MLEEVDTEELEGVAIPFSTDIKPQAVKYSIVFRYTTFSREVE
ncbi:hypothetical protein [Oceanobacillus sp. J11TS1]|nr:hypothetical protein [Oceanobacillus sp. J11TS1]